MTYALHPATPAHLPELARLLAKAVPESYASAIAVAQPRYGAYLHDHLTQGTTCVLFAESKGQPVAAAEFRRVPDGLFLNALWVEEAFRGMGIGRGLMDKAIRDASPPHVSLDVDDANLRAKEGYLRQGFEEVSRTILTKGLPPDVSFRPEMHTVKVQPAERRAFLRYGFCMIQLGEESLGLMGTRVLRANAPLSAQARATAQTLFPRRTLWHFGPAEGQYVATLVRMRKVV